MSDQDHYDAYYADKLWSLLPAVYRTEDTEVFGKAGPLLELVNRIGAQVAVVRRSIDRLWEDQSIESCDDWVIPYIGDLLATRLVASLDARGQRLDVAKTIYYRRRQGTVAILEEIAADISGWNVRLVEFFRRLGRTRHNFDPPLQLSAAIDQPEDHRKLQEAQGLSGRLTHTLSGGWADLRNVYGAGKAHSAFDEFFHSADLRRGRGKFGWHNIPNLGVFVWRLRSFGVGLTTPVRYKDCPDHYTFDPTGREIPLFAAELHPLGDQWVSPEEWQLPTVISKSLLATRLKELYAKLVDPDQGKVQFNSLGVFDACSSLIPVEQITADMRDLTDEEKKDVRFFINPERGLFVRRKNENDQITEEVVFVSYHYGFSSTIGAGPYDRRIPGKKPAPMPNPVIKIKGGGGGKLVDPAQDPPLIEALGTIASTGGTLTIQDSLTYDQIIDLNIGSVTVMLRAEYNSRPLIRLSVSITEWVFTGAADSELVLDGLFISGGDIALRGEFKSVTLNFCTLDPGTAGTTAVDGRKLPPCHLRVEGQVQQLTINRCITGPIATHDNGEIENLTIVDSIVQALAEDKTIELGNGEVRLSRCTLLGQQATVHRLIASECILDCVMQVEDYQHGCVRFSAWTQEGSILPRQYESVIIANRASLFTTRDFGQPAYAQLSATVDAAIAAGAEDGSEMGAFAGEQNSIKERSLLIKFEEFMPLGLNPVVIYVT